MAEPTLCQVYNNGIFPLGFPATRQSGTLLWEPVRLLTGYGQVTRYGYSSNQ